MKFKLICLLGLALSVNPTIGFTQVTSNTATSTSPKKVITTTQFRGILLDSITHEGEPFATIRIYRKGNQQKPVKMLVTDGNGKFQDKMSGVGDFILSISSVGKKTVTCPFQLKDGQKEYNFGTLHISEATEMLKGVEVVAQKPLVKVDIDKIEYNIEEDPDSKSNTIIEMLRKVPMVTIDGEDNIQVNGSSNFKIHLNGKPNNMMSKNPKDVLKSMPANTIKSIEVITNPGAKYDAEGVGGILNIITVSGAGMEGYTATFRGNMSNMGAGTGLYTTIKTGKLTFSLNGNFNQQYSPKSHSDNTQEQWDLTGKKSLLTSKFSNKNSGNFEYGNIEASYEIDTLRLLSFGFGLWGGNMKNDQDGKTVMEHNIFGPDYQYDSRANNKNSWYSINGSIDYQRSFKRNKKELITLSYRIDTQPSSSKGSSVFEYETEGDWLDYLNLKDRKNDGKTNTTEHTFQVDYTKPFAKVHTLETGVKYILRDNTSDSKFFMTSKPGADYELDDKNSTNYEHISNILAAYVGYSVNIKKFGFKAGARYEHTMQEVNYKLEKDKGRDFDINYDNVVPTVNLSYKLAQTQTLRMSYNMRISRPGIWYLDPYVNEMNPTNVGYGNPNLDSEKGHNFNLNYGNFGQKLNLNISLGHSFTNNSIERYSYVGQGVNGALDKEGVMYNTYANIGKSQNTRLSTNIGYTLPTKTRIDFNGSVSYSDMRSPSQNLKNNGWRGTLYLGVQQTFPWDVKASLGLHSSTPYIRLQGKGSGYTGYYVGVNRDFLKKRINIGLNASNFFDKYRKFNNEIIGSNFISKSHSRYPSCYYGVSVSYRIGNLKASVKKAAKSIRNDDVKGGGNQTGGSEGGN